VVRPLGKLGTPDDCHIYQVMVIACHRFSPCSMRPEILLNRRGTAFEFYPLVVQDSCIKPLRKIQVYWGWREGVAKVVKTRDYPLRPRRTRFAGFLVQVPLHPEGVVVRYCEKKRKKGKVGHDIK
jgi:hypothetical protein